MIGVLCPKCKTECKDSKHCANVRCPWRVCETCEIVFTPLGKTMAWTQKGLRKKLDK